MCKWKKYSVEGLGIIAEAFLVKTTNHQKSRQQ
jgi:hypothetical protein